MPSDSDHTLACFESMHRECRLLVLAAQINQQMVSFVAIDLKIKFQGAAERRVFIQSRVAELCMRFATTAKHRRVHAEICSFALLEGGTFEKDALCRCLQCNPVGPHSKCWVRSLRLWEVLRWRSSCKTATKKALVNGLSQQSCIMHLGSHQIHCPVVMCFNLQPEERPFCNCILIEGLRQQQHVQVEALPRRPPFFLSLHSEDKAFCRLLFHVCCAEAQPLEEVFVTQ